MIFSLSRLGLFVLVSGQWSFVCRNQSGQRVTAPRRCDLFSASPPLPPRFFPSLPPWPPQPSQPQTRDGGHHQHLGHAAVGRPCTNPGITRVFPSLFFYSCLSALLVQWRNTIFRAMGSLLCQFCLLGGSSFLMGPWTVDVGGPQDGDAQGVDIQWGKRGSCGHHRHWGGCKLKACTQQLQSIPSHKRLPKGHAKLCYFVAQNSIARWHLFSLKAEGLESGWGSQASKCLFGVLFGRECIESLEWVLKVEQAALQKTAFLCKSICLKCRRGLIGINLRKLVCLAY